MEGPGTSAQRDPSASGLPCSPGPWLGSQGCDHMVLSLFLWLWLARTLGLLSDPNDLDQASQAMGSTFSTSHQATQGPGSPICRNLRPCLVAAGQETSDAGPEGSFLPRP